MLVGVAVHACGDEGLAQQVTLAPAGFVSWPALCARCMAAARHRCSAAGPDPSMLAGFEVPVTGDAGASSAGPAASPAAGITC